MKKPENVLFSFIGEVLQDAFSKENIFGSVPKQQKRKPKYIYVDPPEPTKKQQPEIIDVEYEDVTEQKRI